MIEISHLTRDYGHGKGIFDVSLSIHQGEAFGFLGPNGAGKTTTIRHLLGFLKAKEGKCLIDGLACFTNHAQLGGKIGYLPGEIALFGDMKGLDYLHFMASYNHLEDDAYMHELLAYFACDGNVKIKKMSKGMKQKIGIVAAFMHDPEILILEEQSSGLDPLMQKKLIDLIQKHKEAGKRF